MVEQENNAAVTDRESGGEMMAPPPKPPIPWGSIRRTIRRCLYALGVVTLVVVFLAFVLYRLQTSVYRPIGSISKEAAMEGQENAFLVGVLFMFPAIATGPVLIICLFAWYFAFVYVWKRRRYYTFLVVIPCIALALGEFFLALVGSVMLAGRTSDRAFTAAAQRGQPLVDAIEAYREATGAYPENLQNLVPVYLQSIPDTGMAGYPEFTYGRTTGEDDPTGGFELEIDCPGSDRFFYWPSGKYEDGMRPMGRWAYFFSD